VLISLLIHGTATADHDQSHCWATRPAFDVSDYTAPVVDHAPRFGRSFLYAVIVTVPALAATRGIPARANSSARPCS
jgi:hypothetical protein